MTILDSVFKGRGDGVKIVEFTSHKSEPKDFIVAYDTTMFYQSHATAGIFLSQDGKVLTHVSL